MSRLFICVLVPLLMCLSDLSLGQVETSEQKDTIKTYQIDEVVVSGTRTAKRIIDVPYPINRIDEKQYKFERKIAVNDVLGSVPGLFLQSRYGNHDVRISIRGFGSRSNSGIRGVRILLDGIPESEPDGQTRIEAIDFQSIGSIEVVKGNSSSLYTNAPGGVINFINDINFLKTFGVAFNQFGSFDLRSNGFKTGVRTEKYGFLLTYNYHHAQGYRPNGEDYWHIVNTVLETSPGDLSHLYVYGYFVDGLIRLPGSLTKAQFDKDPFQPNAKDISRDTRRITAKGRVAVRFNTFLEEEQTNEIDMTLYGTSKYFERTASNFRIISRDGFGATARFVTRTELFGRPNEFTMGTDLFYQSGPVETYQNIGGKKGDRLDKLFDETIGNTGFYIQNTFNLIRGQLDLLLSGRYDKVIFDSRNLLAEVQNDARRFEDFTPKAALNFKLTPTIAAFTSYGLSFDSPAANELDNPKTTSSSTARLLNPDLKPQESKNFELGVKGNVVTPKEGPPHSLFFEATFFNTVIDDEIVPFEVATGDVFFRNSARTRRTGLELGANVEIVKGLKLKASYTFSDFKYKAYLARTIVDSMGNEVVRDRDFSNNVVPSVPKHNLGLALSHEQELAEKVTGFVKLSYVNISGMYTDDGNSERTTGYQLVNATVGLDIVLDRFDLLISAGANNIANKTYVAFININSTNKQFYEAGEPRNYFAGINLGYAL